MSLLISALAARCVPFAFLATMTLLGASGNPVLEVSQTRTISGSPAAVWAVIGEFCAIRRWHRQARACALFHDEGQIVRSIDLRDIGTVVEVQLDRDEDAMTYSYTLVRSPWPVKQYRASLTVTPMGQGTVVVWRATFRLNDACDEGAVARIEDLFRSGLADVAREVTR